MRCAVPAVLVVLAVVSGCRQPAPATSRQFPLTGEILAISADRSEITVKHDEVKGFMDAMTMPFVIKDRTQLDGLAVGDLVAATLVVTDEGAYLTGLRKTGTVRPDQRDLIKAHPR
jgi:protein SCO1/2